MADRMIFRVTALDRALLVVAPGWARSRMVNRAAALILARNYEAANSGRRTSNWGRSYADANVAAGASLAVLRALSRDLRRNNPWARRGVQVIANNTVGWGIVARPAGASEELAAAWQEWSETTQCDADGRLTFYGMQRQAMDTVVESGEVLVRARWRYPEDGLAIPLQLQILEPDFIDTTKDNFTGLAGGPVVQGVEFDKLGRRVAYWLFPEHPGSNKATGTSRRIPASEILHVFRAERPGQVRGVPWLAAVIARLREFDEYEDATVMRHKVGALFAAFKVDPTGDPTGISVGEQGTDARGLAIETIEPGSIVDLGAGQDIRFANPPVPADGGFTDRSLRAVSSGLGVTFEDLTGDYSNVNYSSGRLGWLAHWSNVEDWRWNMLIPQMCAPAWGWAMRGAALAGLLGKDPNPVLPRADWTTPARPMIDPDKEGSASMRRIRSGISTLMEEIRAQGKEPNAHLREIAESNKKLDDLGIWLDSDPRRVSAAGLTQARPGATGFNDDAKEAPELAAEATEAEGEGKGDEDEAADA